MTRELRPNSTQIPDVILDFWLSELSGAELKVVLYVARRTYGFGKESDNISLSQICTGITKRNGIVQDTGTGLSRSSVARAIKTLEEQKIIIRQINLSETSNEHEESTYSLNLDWQTEKRNEPKSGVVPKSNHPVSKRETGWSQNGTTRSPKIELGVVPKSNPQETDIQETDIQETAATADALVATKVSPAIPSAVAVSSGKEFHQDSFDLLQAQGFDADAARRLAVHPAEHIQKQIELLAQRKPSQNPLGLLRRAIEGNYGVPSKAIKLPQTKQPASGKDAAARVREAQKRDLEDYAVYREQQRETLKARHADVYRAYEQENADKRAEIARRAPYSMELAMFDKRGIEEARFAEFFRQYAPCPALPFEEWVQAGKPKSGTGEAVPFALTIPDLAGSNAAL